MRIISGTRRGHKLLEFDGGDVRPTTDRVKEAVFNLIQGFIADAVCLDMFAGSGALSFEAISRGAKKAVIIDKDRRSIDIIRKNADALAFTEKCDIINASCFDYLKTARGKFDIIFLDPPYNKGFIEPALKAVTDGDFLAEDGIIVLESDNTDFRAETEALCAYKQRKYGRTYITVYKNRKKVGQEDDE